MIFLKSYIRFGNTENNNIFDKKIKQITGRKESMGIEEMVLDMERKRGLARGKKLGLERGEKRGIEQRNREVILNMLQKNFTDETIADLIEIPIDYVQKIRASLK